MKERIIPALVLMTMLAAIGCGRSARSSRNVESLVRDYNRTWKAVHTVMSKHFLIKSASESKGLIVAVPLRNDGRMGQAETRVSAKIFASKTGGYNVEIRAANYVEISEPRALSSKTPRYEWTPVSFDQRLQTQLLNEIDELRYDGMRAEQENKFLESPKEEVPLIPDK